MIIFFTSGYRCKMVWINFLPNEPVAPVTSIGIPDSNTICVGQNFQIDLTGSFVGSVAADTARSHRRFGDVHDRVVVLGADVLRGQRPAVTALLFRVVAGQVGAELGPAGAAVAAFQHLLGAVVNDRRVVR